MWWSYALNPGDRRDPDTMRDVPMCWVKGIRPPQPEKFDADGTTFFVTFFNGIIIDIKQL
jgi:hypothetical protein